MTLTCLCLVTDTEDDELHLAEVSRHPVVGRPIAADAQLIATLNILALLSKTAWRFSDFRHANSLLHREVDEHYGSLGGALSNIAQQIFADPNRRERVDTTFASDLQDEQKRLNKGPPDPPPLPPAAGSQSVAVWARRTQQATQGRLPAGHKQNVVPLPKLAEEQRIWFEELASGLADVTESLCWHAQDPIWFVQQRHC
jgi:hypothetical protein